MSVIGTTDDDFYGDLDDAVATEDEVAYIREAAARVLPGMQKFRMQRTYVGIRPTLFRFGVNEEALSRAHLVFDHAEDGAANLYTMSGGKLASYRQFAEEAANVVARRLHNSEPCRTHEEALPGGERMENAQSLRQTFSFPLHVLGRIAYRHGARSRAVLEHAAARGSGACVICVCEPVTEGEIAYVVAHESVRRLADVRRRTRLAMGACQGARCFSRAAAVMREVTGMPALRSLDELRDAITARWRGMRPVMEGPNMAVAELHQHVHLGVGSLNDVWQAVS
jgi:glycerol-3-phosphate dehydrogenase